MTVVNRMISIPALSVFFLICCNGKFVFLLTIYNLYIYDSYMKIKISVNDSDCYLVLFAHLIFQSVIFKRY
jgi:hypothetical protein